MHETLEKQGCWTQNVLKIIVAGIGQGRQVAEEDRRRPMMLEEKSCCRMFLHAPRGPAHGEQDRSLWWRMWFTRAPSRHWICGLGLRRTFLSGRYHPTLPRSACFKTPTSAACYVFRDVLEIFFFLFWLIFEI